MRDVVVVGAGPNGLTAAVELARRGLLVEVFEARETVGGGARTEELTLPGFRHDPCSAVHPMGAGSPAFLGMGEQLRRHGLHWLHPELPLAHPYPDGSAAVLADTPGQTAASLGPVDAGRYRRLVEPFTGKWDALAGSFLTVPWQGLPRDPLALARFGLVGMPPASWLIRRFAEPRAKALMAGLAAHAIAPLSTPSTAGMALVFALAAHEHGWPVARGGSQSIADALAGYLRELGGTVHTGVEVKQLDELPPARAYVFDTSPTALARIAGLGRAFDGFRYGAAAFKIDYALDGPVPWAAEAASSHPTSCSSKTAPSPPAAGFPAAAAAR
jgi:phytoene dehydrogenase-like protein